MKACDKIDSKKRFVADVLLKFMSTFSESSKALSLCWLIMSYFICYKLLFELTSILRALSSPVSSSQFDFSWLKPSSCLSMASPLMITNALVPFPSILMLASFSSVSSLKDYDCFATSLSFSAASAPSSFVSNSTTIEFYGMSIPRNSLILKRMFLC